MQESGPAIHAPVSPSFAQDHLRFLAARSFEGTAANVPLTLRIRTGLDEDVLRRALAALWIRHRALRTYIAVDSLGEPFPEVAPPDQMVLDCLDLSNAAPRVREELLQEHLAALTAQPFVIGKPPLVRVTLLRLGASDHVVHFVFHPALCCGSVVPSVVRELAELYSAGLGNGPASMANRPESSGLFSRKNGEASLGYWENALRGAQTVLEIPTDRPRAQLPSLHGNRFRFCVDAITTDALQQLAQAEGATLFMAVLAVFSLALSRYAETEDLLIGVPKTNREADKAEEVPGLFADALIVGADLAGDPSFRVALQRVRTAVVGAQAHQDTPLKDIIEALSPASDFSRHPLFQVWLEQSEGTDSAALPDGWESFGDSDCLTSFDLKLRFSLRAQSLWFDIEYPTDLFNGSTIESFARRFNTILSAAIADADRPVARLRLLSNEEERCLTHTWNGATVDNPPYTSPVGLFVEQAARTPAAVALEQGGQTLTYADLDRLSNQLAWYLGGLDIAPETPVGIYLQRDFSWVVSVLGVMKAGCCYVPLDISYPPQRLARMIEIAGVGLVVTSSTLRSSAPFAESVRVIELEPDFGAIGSCKTSAPPRAGAPDGIAYILFTSGSTGEPKGVMTRNRSVVNYLLQMSCIFALDATDSVLQVTSPSFGPSMRELLAPLASGARLFLLPAGEAGSPTSLMRAVQTGKVSKIVAITPSMLKLMLVEAEESDPGSSRLSLVCPSGELLERSVCNSVWQKLGRSVRIVNLYGQTESTMTLCSFQVQGEQGSPRVPIGRPIANTRIYVLDSQGEAAAVGTPGEIHIGGAGISRGYVGRPGLTADRFVPNPFGDGERLYRTGDRGRWLAEGVLECLGRVDQQLKIRGYRIEPGEIETLLHKHPSVKQAVVVAREDAMGDMGLVAYVVPAPGESPQARQLQAHLKLRLPDYLVPARFVVLDKMPLTPTAKVDRRALPVPDAAPEGAEYGAPRTPEEKTLARIWEQVLRVERVGVEDDFFDLGGHSVSAMRVITQIRKSMQVDLPLRAFFEARTLASLAARVERQRRDGYEVVRPVLRRHAQDGPAPLSYAQERLWFLDN